MSSPELTKRRPAREKLVLGWRERVALPELGIPPIKAKIDTGARTSALHATHIKVRQVDGRNYVDFTVPGEGDPSSRRRTALLVDQRSIKNTSGIAEERLIIRTLLSIAGRRWSIEVSLTDRMAMTFDLILGRTAIRGHNVLIDPGLSYVSDRPPARN